MMTERCDRCANISGLCAMVGCGGFVEKAPLEAVVEIANAPQHAKETPLPTLCEVTACPDNIGPGSCKRGLNPESCTV